MTTLIRAAPASRHHLAVQSRKGSAASIFKTEKKYKSSTEKSQTKSMNVCHSDKWHHYRKNNKSKYLFFFCGGQLQCPTPAANSTHIAGVVLLLLGCKSGKKDWYVAKLMASLLEEHFIFPFFHKQ